MGGTGSIRLCCHRWKSGNGSSVAGPSGVHFKVDGVAWCLCIILVAVYQVSCLHVIYVNLKRETSISVLISM